MRKAAGSLANHYLAVVIGSVCPRQRVNIGGKEKIEAGELSRDVIGHTKFGQRKSREMQKDN